MLRTKSISPWGIRRTEATARFSCSIGYYGQKCSDQNWHRHSKTGLPCAIEFLDAVEEALSFPAQFYGDDFLYLR